MGQSVATADRYRLLRLLGEGGSGQVWLAADAHRSGALCAVKEPRDASPERVASLLREFAALASIQHPGVVEARELDVSPAGLPRFSLEYVEGRDFTSAGREGVRSLLGLTAQALRAVAFLHDFGFLHRDIKPGNLLVRSLPRLGWTVVLLDLGLAVRGGSAPATAGVAGTLPYLAPEVLDGAPPSRRSDLYALGTVVHEALHGHPPVPLEGRDLVSFLAEVRSGRRDRRPLPPDAPPGLAGWLDEMLAMDAAARPADALEALARLNAACGLEEPITTPVDRAARLASGRPAGRDRECERLWRELEREDGARLVWLAGGAGTGKSRLLRWLAADAVARGHTVITPPERTALTPPADAAGSQGVEDTLALWAEHARRERTLVLLDEVEAADVRTVEVLDRLARQRTPGAVRVVAAIEPSEVRQPALRRLLDGTELIPSLHRIDLEPLDAGGVRAMAVRATGTREVSDARVRWLLSASEGVPAVCEALLVEAAWERGATSPAASAVDGAAAARLQLVSGPGRRFLEALAVLGSEVPDEPLLVLAELDPAGADQAGHECAAAGLARRRASGWRLSSTALREHVLAPLPEERRVALHRRAAELVAKARPLDPWRLARLLAGAGDPDAAVEHAVRAAQVAERQADPVEAAARLSFALRNLSRRDRRRRGLRMRLAEARSTAGLHQAAARSFGAAVFLSTTPAEQIAARALQAHALALASRFELADRIACQVEKEAHAAGLVREEAQAKRVRAIVLARKGRLAEALTLFEAATPLFEKIGDEALQAEMLHSLAACKGNLRHPDAEAAYERSLEANKRCGNVQGWLKSFHGLAVTQVKLGRYAQAREKFEEIRRVGAHGNMVLLQLATSVLAEVTAEIGQLDLAAGFAREARDLALHLGDVNITNETRNTLANILILAGRPAEAAEECRRVLAETTNLAPQTVEYGQILLATALLELGPDYDAAAADLLDRAISTSRQRRQRRPLLVSLVTELERRAVPGARDPFDPVRIEFDAIARSADSPIEPELQIRADLARAASLLNRGNPAGAKDPAQAALRLAQDSSRAVEVVCALGLLGEALDRTGDREGAIRAIERGRRLLDDTAQRIEDVDARAAFLARPVFRRVREASVVAAQGADRRLVALYDMIRALNSETDPEVLLETILDMALQAVQAERGMILIRESGKDDFSVRVSRNLERETRKDAESYSRGIVAQAGTGQSVLALDAGHDERFRNLRSVSLFGIRSLMCVPLRSRGTIIGTVYLDSRREGALFSQDDLSFIEAFADHAALALENARARADLERENRRLQQMAEARVQLGKLYGRSRAMQAVFDLVEKVAASDLPVLIVGESGTGKELVAQAIHSHGPRRRRIFLTENCAAIPETLLESTLFGHVRGAFTGAERDQTGLFEQADGGTLFLDEIGDMSLAMQARLLRAVQEGEIRPVGGKRVLKVDVRILAATHRELEAEVAAGRFRQDLYHRLNVLRVQIPPLRDREGEIPLLVQHLLERIAKARGRTTLRVDRKVMEVFERYAWPGNVRQLENALQRLTLLSGGGPVTLGVLQSDPGLRSVLLPGGREEDARFSLARNEKEQIQRALEASGGNRDQAARMLGISRATIYRKIREYKLR